MMAGSARTEGNRIVAARLRLSGRWTTSTVPHSPPSRTVRAYESPDTRSTPSMVRFRRCSSIEAQSYGSR